MADLHWVVSEDGKQTWLHCGVLEADLATLTKANKWWEAIIWLPGISPAKQYAPLEAQKADCEKRVSDWFGLALTSRPIAESYSDE